MYDSTSHFVRLHYMFTGKERDNESGLDYFGARYYASNMGRWMSPDWASNPAPVPFAKIENPQTLNLYAYLNNTPLSGIDLDGHAPVDCSGSNASKIGCQAIAKWNAEHDVLSTESKNAIAKSSLTSQQKVDFSNTVVKEAGNKSVDPNLIVGLANTESSINPNAVAHSTEGDARGIFQILPAQQSFLKLSDAQVWSVTGAIPAVSGYFGHYIDMFGSRKGEEFGEPLAIASWTMGVTHTLRVFNSGGMKSIRDVDLGDPQHHRVGPDYIDKILSFEK